MPRDYPKAYAQLERSLREPLDSESIPPAQHEPRLSSNLISTSQVLGSETGSRAVTEIPDQRDNNSTPKGLPYAARSHLPPTPPSNIPLDESSKEQANPTLQFNDQPIPDLNSHTNPQNLPTPDPTPPNSADHFKPLQPREVPLASPYTESFMTAKEDNGSDGSISSHLDLPLEGTQEASGQDLHSGGQSSGGLRNLGWGIGDLAEGSDATPIARKPPVRFVHLADGIASPDSEWDPVKARDVTIRHKPRRRDAENEGLTFLEDELKLETPTSESAQSSWLESPSKEMLPKSILTHEPEDSLPTNLSMSDEYKRNSNDSVNSTIVEAMIVDTPSPTTHRLRHVGKRDFLREQVKLESQQGFESPMRNRDSQVKNIKKDGTRERRPTSHGFTYLSMDSANTQLRSILPSALSGGKRQASSWYATESLWEDGEKDKSPLTRNSAPGFHDLLRRVSSSSDSMPPETRLTTFYSHVSSGKPESKSSVDSLDMFSLDEELSNTKPSTFKAEVPLQVGSPGNFSPQKRSSKQVSPTSQLSSKHETLERTSVEQSMGLSPAHRHSRRTSALSLSEVQSEVTDAQEVNQATAISIFPHNNDSLMLIQDGSRPTSQSVPNQELRTLPLLEAEPDEMSPIRTIPISFGEHETGATEEYRTPQISIIRPIPPQLLQPETRSFAYAPNQQQSGLSRSRSLMNRAREYSENIFQPIKAMTSPTGGLLRRNTTRRRRAPQQYSDGTVRSRQKPVLRPLSFPREPWEDPSDTEEETLRYPYHSTTLRGPELSNYDSPGITNDISSNIRSSVLDKPLPSSPIKRGASIKGFLFSRNRTEAHNSSHGDPIRSFSLKRKRGNVTGSSSIARKVSVRDSARRSGR